MRGLIMKEKPSLNNPEMPDTRVKFTEKKHALDENFTPSRTVPTIHFSILHTKSPHAVSR